MNDFPKKDTVVSFAAMRKELLSKRRLSPTVAARARLSELRELAGEGDKIIVPFFQAAAMACYLDNNRHIDGAEKAASELIIQIRDAVEAREFIDPSPSSLSLSPIALFVEVSLSTFETFAMIPFDQIMRDMQAKFTDELSKHGYESF